MCQSVTGLGGPTTATNSFVCPGPGVICSAEALEQSPNVGMGLSSLGGGGARTETSLPSLWEALSVSVGVSSSSRIEGLNRYCANTPRGGNS
jgi:hypothetical protein